LPDEQIEKFLVSHFGILFSSDLLTVDLGNSIAKRVSAIENPGPYFPVFLDHTRPVFAESIAAIRALVGHPAAFLEQYFESVDRLSRDACFSPACPAVCQCFCTALSQLQPDEERLTRWEIELIRQLHRIFSGNPTLRNAKKLGKALVRAAERSDPLALILDEMLAIEARFYAVYLVVWRYYGGVGEEKKQQFREAIAERQGSLPGKERAAALEKLLQGDAKGGFMLALSDHE
jgi:hypothetical protein